MLSILIQAGHPTVVRAKGKANALEVWVDRNGGNGFVFLIIHTEPNTPDPPRYQCSLEVQGNLSLP